MATLGLGKVDARRDAMNGKKLEMTNSLFLFAVVLWLLPAYGEAATFTVDCDAKGKIQEKLELAKPGDTVLVSGTCSENVTIPSEVVRITLDGQGKTVIKAPGTTADAIFIRGKDIMVKGFTLTGGRDGIHLSGAAAGASAIIDGKLLRPDRLSHTLCAQTRSEHDSEQWELWNYSVARFERLDRE